MTGGAVASRLFNSTGLVLACGLFWMPMQDPGAGPATTTARVSFDVVSIKPTQASDTGVSFVASPPGGRFTAQNTSLRELLVWAYGDPDDPDHLSIAGAPDWMDSTRFDVKAVGGPGDRPPETAQRVQALLSERFGLVAHREQRTLPVYALVVERRGDGKLTPSDVSCPPPVPIPRSPATDDLPCGLRVGPDRLSADATTMEKLAENLARRPDIDRSIVDRTGLTGRFRVDLHWTPSMVRVAGARGMFPSPPTPASPAQNADAPAAPGVPAVGVRGPSLPDALREQLGLKLENTTAPVEVLVIDRVHKPTPD